jgi:hypothetical protein
MPKCKSKITCKKKTDHGKCVICYGERPNAVELVSKEKGSDTNLCGHKMCLECKKNWLDEKCSTCPFCRREVESTVMLGQQQIVKVTKKNTFKSFPLDDDAFMQRMLQAMGFEYSRRVYQALSGVNFQKNSLVISENSNYLFKIIDSKHNPEGQKVFRTASEAHDVVKEMFTNIARSIGAFIELCMREPLEGDDTTDMDSEQMFFLPQGDGSGIRFRLLRRHVHRIQRE